MSTVIYRYENKLKKTVGGEKVIHNETIIDGAKGLSFTFTQRTTKGAFYKLMGKETEPGKFEVTETKDEAKGEPKAMSKADLLKLLKKTKGLEFVIKYIEKEQDKVRKELELKGGRKRRAKKASKKKSSKKKSKKRSRKASRKKASKKKSKKKTSKKRKSRKKRSRKASRGKKRSKKSKSKKTSKKKTSKKRKSKKKSTKRKSKKKSKKKSSKKRRSRKRKA